ncbi:hypothetical protein DLJ49_19550 [Rhodovulum sp. 12E13]|nr:hypothetical protein DLJ49_19550 [Rhodovulum sp. 12E13]
MHEYASRRRGAGAQDGVQGRGRERARGGTARSGQIDDGPVQPGRIPYRAEPAEPVIVPGRAGRQPRRPVLAQGADDGAVAHRVGQTAS